MIPEVHLENPQGTLIDLAEYRRLCALYNKDALPVFCPACRSGVTPYDPADLDKPRGFRHLPEIERPWCSLGDEAGSGPVPPVLSSEAEGRRVRAEFMRSYLEDAYMFCNRRSWGHMDRIDFHRLVRIADRKRLWQSENLQLWAIPFHLLREHRFAHKSKKTNKVSHYYFDFRMGSDPAKKSPRTATLWLHPHKWMLPRLFQDSGKMTDGEDNLDRISEDTWHRQVEFAQNHWTRKAIPFDLRKGLSE